MWTFYGIVKRNIGTSSVLAVYLAVYIFIINKGHGIPYVMDNNETFSSLNHAYNLWHFDFFRSFGLTDEAASPFAAAHPFVHTHQGNFPRLFSFLLFVLGARSAETQIWITTFTVGLASVLMAKRFFRRTAGDLFATIFVLILITDYLLFAQWQVNTYRVWHGFFLFGSLLCVHGLSDWKRSHWALATVSLYAALLYWELIFAAFVAITAGTYTLWLYRHTPRFVLIAGALQSLGAAIGLGILITQLLLYLGWHDFLVDIKWTFTARNIGLDSIVSIEQLRNFFSSRNIVFWENIQSGSAYNGVDAFLRSIFANAFQVSTPLFVFINLILAIAGLAADSRLPSGSDIKVVDPRVAFASTIALAIGIAWLLTALILSGDNLLGPPMQNALAVGIWWWLFYFFLIIPLAIVVAISLRRLAAAISTSGTPPGLRRCQIAGAYFLFIGVFAVAQVQLYNQADKALWLGLLTPITGVTAAFVIGASGLAGGLLVLAGKRSVIGLWRSVPASIVPFFLSGLLGYLFVYKFSAGYLHSGYLYRLCPLLVFHVDALLALGATVALAISSNMFDLIKVRRSSAAVKLLAAVSCTLCLTLLGYWGVLQYQYIKILPPDRFSFVQILKARAAPDEGIVSNTYAAPFGYVAHTWATMNPEFGELAIPARGETSISPASTSYLWFADHRTNQIYNRPGIFVCFEQFGFYHGLINPGDKRFYMVPRCSNMPIATGQTAQGKNGIPHARLIGRDEKDNLWAVYRLNWEQSSPQH